MPGKTVEKSGVMVGAANATDAVGIEVSEIEISEVEVPSKNENESGTSAWCVTRHQEILLMLVMTFVTFFIIEVMILKLSSVFRPHPPCRAKYHVRCTPMADLWACRIPVWHVRYLRGCGMLTPHSGRDGAEKMSENATHYYIEEMLSQTKDP